MGHLRIGVWMTFLSLGLVLIVVAGLAPAGLALLGGLAEENARARVRLAALGAREALEGIAHDAATSAHLLAERPTLLGLLDTGRADELRGFLAQFRATGELDGCAVVTDEGILAASPAELPWDELTTPTAEARRFLAPAAGQTAPLAVAEAPLAGGRMGRAVVVRRLDGRLVRQLQAQVGLPLRLLTGCEDDGSGTEAVLEGGSWRARASAGGPLCIEALLPLQQAEAALRSVQRAFAAVALMASLLAVTAGVLASRRLARPLADLRAAAQRIGAGDLASPVPAARGVEAGALASTMEDMRRRLRDASAALQEREAEAKALLEGIVEGVFAVDGERRIQYLSPPAARRLGVSPEDAVGRFCGDVLRPVERAGRRPCDEACPIVHARSRGTSRAVEHLRLPGGRRTVVVTSSPPTGARQVQLLRDETELEAARRSRDAVLANVSHELKTPLSAQLASIELLRDALEEGRRAESELELVDALERSTLRLTRLIDNLLESVRIETGQATCRRLPVDLVAVVEEAEALMAPLLRQRGQVVEVELPPRAEVAGDPVQLAQVLVNLLANANKFAPPGSTIRIGCERANGRVWVWIEDAGPGVPERERGAVFDHYYRVDPGAAEGMGLGLWIVRSIVERHGGSVEASAAAAGGARFTVNLPASEGGPA